MSMFSTRTPMASDDPEPLLTEEALARVRLVAESEIPGGTVVGIDIDTDGVAAYEAQLTEADGTLVTVYVDRSFQFVAVK